jgi:shikimate kinase
LAEPTEPTEPTGSPTALDADGRPRHLVLVGLMGAGKTTIGRRVAALLDRPFLDADDELAERSGRTVRAWFEEDGEQAFRKAEAGFLRTLLDAHEPVVLATGGGVVVAEENRLRLTADDVTVVWLHGEPAFLASRAKPKDHRPLLADDPRTTLERLFAEREHWYREVADIVIDVQPAFLTESKPKDRLAEEVVAGIVRCRDRTTS